MIELFPIIEPYVNGYIDVSELHRMYSEEWGNKNRKPIVFIHPRQGVYLTNWILELNIITYISFIAQKGRPNLA